MLSELGFLTNALPAAFDVLMTSMLAMTLRYHLPDTASALYFLRQLFIASKAELSRKRCWVALYVETYLLHLRRACKGFGIIDAIVFTGDASTGQPPFRFP